MTSLTESAQGWNLAPFFFFALNLKKLNTTLNIERLNSNECSPMYQYCCTNWRWVGSAPEMTTLTSIHGTWEHLLSHLSITSLSLSSAWDPFIFVYVKERYVAVRGMHPGHSNVISTSLIHSRPLILAQNLPTPFFKKQKQKTRRNLRVMPRIAHRKYPYFPFSIPGRRNSDDLLTWIFAHFGKPHHHINSEKEIKTYVHWVEAYLPPEFSMNTAENLCGILRSLSSSWLPLPLSCLSSAFETASRAPP